MATSLAWWQAQLEIARTAAAAYGAAITAFSTSNVQSFTLDTGQSRHTVMKKDLTQLKTTYNSLLNTVATLEARIYGAAGQARPAW